MVLYYLIFVPTFIKAPQYIYALIVKPGGDKQANHGKSPGFGATPP